MTGSADPSGRPATICGLEVGEAASSVMHHPARLHRVKCRQGQVCGSRPVCADRSPISAVAETGFQATWIHRPSSLTIRGAFTLPAGPASRWDAWGVRPVTDPAGAPVQHLLPAKPEQV
jgi:hypothetical protein